MKLAAKIRKNADKYVGGRKICHRDIPGGAIAVCPSFVAIGVFVSECKDMHGCQQTVDNFFAARGAKFGVFVLSLQKISNNTQISKALCH